MAGVIDLHDIDGMGYWIALAMQVESNLQRHADYLCWLNDPGSADEWPYREPVGTPEDQSWPHGDPVDLAHDAWADDPDRAAFDDLPDPIEPEGGR